MVTRKHEIAKDQLLYLYTEYGTIAAVARALECSPKVVSAAMKRYDLDYERVPRKYAINHHFFYTDNECEAQFYWAGFLAANANVTRTSAGESAYRIELNTGFRDLPFLDKMVRALGSDVPVKEVWVKLRGQPYQQARVVLNSKYMIQDLQRFNVVPKKKHSYAMPECLLRHKMVRHFLRGWVDGTGNFYTRDDLREFRTRGTIHFLEQFRNVLNENLDLRKKDASIVQVNRYSGMLRYGMHDDVMKIAHFLYDGATHLMERKKDAALFGIMDSDIDAEELRDGGYA
ncbi:MAG TPA: hypothetical protein VI423_10695 [Paenisporosarcina sp.]|nr:hypothetical protein [Paenisporosarcina sp.]